MSKGMVARPNEWHKSTIDGNPKNGRSNNPNSWRNGSGCLRRCVVQEQVGMGFAIGQVFLRNRQHSNKL